ncbi:hypothetical protein [Ensifer sp. MJa1]|uniref:hypothetical protein n=1 Tax=Ensifer sp. MJa1 TaxID=2919888 RepID=UPI00300BDD1A
MSSSAYSKERTQRYLLLRLTSAQAGITFLGTCSIGDGANASMSLFLYCDAAEARAGDSEAKWRAWFEKTFG